MVTLVSGVPDSGKTAYCVDKIKKIASNDIKELSHIENVYTNIAGFKFHFFSDNKVNFERLDFKNLYEHLKIMHKIYIDNDGTEKSLELLIEYTKKNGLFASYFVIDEAQNYFDNLDKVKLWWITYHAQLQQQIDLITQNKALIHAKYISNTELFIKAMPRSKAVSEDTLRYFHYTEPRMTKKYQSSEVKVDEDFFKLYKTFKKSTQKPVGRKYIIYFVLFVFFLITMFTILLMKMMSSDTPIEEQKEITQTEVQPRSEPIYVPTQKDKSVDIYDIEGLIYMQLLCSPKFKYCLYNNKRINFDFYLKMKDLQNFKEFSLTKITDDFYKLDVFVTESFYQIYSGGANNEKDNFIDSNSKESTSF